MKYVIASDLHGNLEAFKSFKEYITQRNDLEGLLLLGDLIDYGPHSNEVVEGIRSIEIPAICNIWGNHEELILGGDLGRLSSDRGRESALYTIGTINSETKDYIENHMEKSGCFEFSIGSQKALAVHGSLKDVFWGKINTESDLTPYEKYDYVFSGHSHIPHLFEQFYSSDNPDMRNKKKTTFINPGSVGQPRNHCPLCQFVIFDADSTEVEFIRLKYDVLKEQSAFSDKIDRFYKDRIGLGV